MIPRASSVLAASSCATASSGVLAPRARAKTTTSSSRSSPRRPTTTSASSSSIARAALAPRDDDASSAPPPPAVVSVSVSRRAGVAAALLGALGATTTLAFAPSASAATGQKSTDIGDRLLSERKTYEGEAQANLNSIIEEIREEESKLKALRFEREAIAREDLAALRQSEETKARQQVVDGKTLCITPFGIDFVGITETVALVGAIGAGLTSNARKAEIAELNEKLRAVNVALRQQIRNPSPNAAPGSGNVVVYPDGGADKTVYRQKLKGLSGGGASGSDDGEVNPGPLDSLDEESATAGALSKDFDSASLDELKKALREGRALLKVETPAAYAEAEKVFNKALMLSRMQGDQVQIRRATRGLAASKRGLGDTKGSIVFLKEVLDISRQLGDRTGDTDALGNIADLYTEIGDLENAGKYYDEYLDALNDEMST